MDFNGLISGWLLMGYFVSGLFFLRFWRSSKDQLFLLFGISFWLLALQRLLVALASPESEHSAAPYLIRLLAFLTILFAIYRKNRSAS